MIQVTSKQNSEYKQVFTLKEILSINRWICYLVAHIAIGFCLYTVNY